MKKIILIISIILIVITLIVVTLLILNKTNNFPGKQKFKHHFFNDLPYLDKPIIYVYPKEKTQINIKLGYPENLTCVYPKYNNAWNITAYPDGTLIDENTKREYYSLYYESINLKKYNESLDEGFIISKQNITTFLEDKLKLLGLNDKEAQEFIIYWLPKLQKYNYIYIRFQTLNEIKHNMPLEISPKPDTLIRIMMEWKGLNNSMNIKEQQLTPITRSGFTVVEWGGTEI